MKKFLLISLLISFSCANSIGNSSNLISIIKGIFDHADQLEMNENLEELKTSDRNCIWQNLKLTPSDEIEALKINDFDIFKSESLKNRKIFEAVFAAANFCESENSTMKHFVDIASFLAAAYGKIDEDVECLKLDLQKIDPESKLLEEFQTSKINEECQKSGSDEEENSLGNSSSEEIGLVELNECLAINKNHKNPKIIHLVVKILSFDLTEENVNKVATIMMKVSKEDTKVMLNCILKDLGIK
ncbi:hypothetical protein PVAND_014761 [Polypedilum vanderplanki]|uniref:Lipoprotein n=1 Tax=Polypedilum vanderplanki TaxID=319348 RepID=A0A9J6BAN6_POLVA|nr:hypothetical protein PVAND_014761 [Polypedilum vanderplanki]